MSASSESIQSHQGNGGSGKICQLIVGLLPVLACFLGGATQKWAEGLVVALLGALLLFRPPQLSLGLWTNAAIIGLMAAAAITFLPANWFYIPPWRPALRDDLNIVLGSTVTPQPWMSATALVSLVAGICWLYRVATLDLDLRGVRFLLRLFVSGIVLLAALSILLYLAHRSFPFWHNERGFGPFPNRNQTADLFGISAIVLLACAQDDFRSGRIRWVLGMAGMGILLAAVILNFSRAGVAILVGGSFVWVIAVALRKRSTAGIALGVSLLLLLLTAILVLGGQTLARFQQWGAGGPGISSDFRWKIFRDTFRLIRNSPWCGIGLANFHSVFGMFRKDSVAEQTVLHPESDWLWLWSETGWPAVVVVLVGGALMFRRLFPLQEGTNQRLRLSALIAAATFAVHGLVDVSGHRVGSAYSGLLLFGMALHRPLHLSASRVIAPLFRFVGGLLLVIGTGWLVAGRTALLIPGGAGVSTAKRLSQAAYQSRDFQATISLTSRALEWAPLDWDLYFRRALAEVASNQTDPALSDFRRARFLEPVAYELPRDEGTAWLGTEPTLAATAWRDALRKAGAKRAEIFSNMLTAAAMRSPAVSELLEQFGLSEPDLALAYLARLSGPAFQRGVSQLLGKDPGLSGLTDPQKLALFDLWSERGDLEELARTIQTHPQLLHYAWLGMAKYHARKGDFQAAYLLTQQFGEAVAMPRATGDANLRQLESRYAANPDNLTIGYSLYQAQMDAGRYDDALDVARHFAERGSAPAYFHYLVAQGWARKANWERAWAEWQAYRQAATKK
jgi:O-antigen ligase/tetratricopeptide (TPR) repeat protein